MKNKYLTFLFCFLALLAYLAKPAISSSSIAQGITIPESIEDIARATTVLIGPDLNAVNFSAGDVPRSAGSGVIVGRSDTPEPAIAGEIPTIPMYRYWVLTNAHVISDEIADYTIRTADGDFHPEGKGPVELDITAIETNAEYIPPKREIYRGQKCDQLHDFIYCEGPDLAVLTFYSDRYYPVAVMGNSSGITTNQQVLVSGWPQSNSPTDLSRHRFSLYANIIDVKQPGEIVGDYTLVTTVRGKQGISGGPVFNANDQVIGIYGSGQTRDENVGSAVNYAVGIDQFRLMVTDPAYESSFSSRVPPILTTYTSESRQEAVSFGQKYAGYLGDNVLEEEKENFYISDLLPDDPRVKDIEYLDKHLGCWHNFQGGKSGAGLLEERGQFMHDLNSCLDSFRLLLATEYTVDAVEVETLMLKIEELAARIATLKGIVQDS
jgi:hypothetical protein